ncbi:MAG: site-specific integrase [Psychrobacillus sp.]
MGENVLSFGNYKLNEEKEETLKGIRIAKADIYKSDFKLFEKFCGLNYLPLDFNSLSIYLHQSVKVDRVRLSTFNRRAAGVKYWLKNILGLSPTEQQNQETAMLRKLYSTEDFLRLKQMRGVKVETQSEVLRLIDRFDTNKPLDIRKRAVCLVNLYTANRPSEMVRLKVSDFELGNRSVHVQLIKQGEMATKRLTLETVEAVMKYIVTFNLQKNDYFVGKIDKWGNYTSKQIKEDTYNARINGWLGFPPYTLRKTQITTMYKNGADLPTIAKQSGHKSHQTIMQHYIKLKADDVDTFL